MERCEQFVESYHKLNYSQIFFILLGAFPILVTFPCWLVAKYIYEPMKKDYEGKYEEIMEMLRVPVEYTEKYVIKDPSGNKLTKLSNIVVDYTPEGNIALRYNKEMEAFEYWSDKNINYKHLETVARKYVNSFGCGSLYIDRMKLLDEKVNKIKKKINENIKKEQEDQQEQQEQQEQENGESKKQIKKDDDVFANLKNYNSQTKTNEVKKKITKNDIVCDKANKYIRKGKFSEYKEWMEPNKKETKTENSGGIMSWLEWKNKSKND